MAIEEPLSKEGRDLKVRCRAMAFYEVRFRLRIHRKDGPQAALVQFLGADGEPVTEEHVSPGFSEEVGRYSYLKANPETGMGMVRFFAPTAGGRLTLRFRTWANRHPVFLGEDIKVRELAGWTIAAEPESTQPVRLIPVARPLSVSVPAGSTVRLNVALRSAADGDKIVLHAPCAMTMEGDRLKLGDASQAGGTVRPFAGRGERIVLPVENAGREPAILSLACEGIAAIDLAEVFVIDGGLQGGTAAGTPGKEPPAPAGVRPSAVSSNATTERTRWTTRVANRLFLRSTIIDTKQELALTAEKVSQIERTLADSLLLVEKKVDYLLAKIDAYAEVDDKNGAALHEGLAAVQQATKELGKSASANQAELRHWQGTVDNRLAAIERKNAELATELTALRQTGQGLGKAIEVGRETMAKRLDAAIERLARIETSHADTVASIEKSAKHTVADINKSVEKITFNEFRQHEALDALQRLLKFDLPLPATRGWAASPDFLLHLYQHIATHRPRTVVELGSGVSTLVAAAALAANGAGGRLYSLDHDSAYAEATSKLVAQHGLQTIAAVYDAPLAPWKPARSTELGEEWQWYNVPRAVNSLKAIDLLIVDGPPEATGRAARYPAVPHFHARMAPGCTVLLDDASRPDEKATAETWSRDDGLCIKLLLRADREFEKGLAILTNNC